MLQIEVDQRRSRRVASQLSVTWLRLSGDVQGKALNISTEGLFFETDALVEVGTLMRLRITLPDGDVNAIGTSRYIGDTHTGHGIGIQLFLMTKDETDRWLHFYHAAAALQGAAPPRPRTKRAARPSADASSAEMSGRTHA